MQDTATAPKSLFSFAGPSRYIVSKPFDNFNFIYAPLLTFALFGYLAKWSWGHTELDLWGAEESPLEFFMGSFIAAHLFIVGFRAYLNPVIFSQYRFRFTVVPVALAVALFFSKTALVCVSVLATWWDVYHSSLQTWGLGRIYDAKQGNNPREGRMLDYGLNILVYAGPILSGASLIDHIEDFEEFSEIGWTQLAALAMRDDYARTLAPYVIALGSVYVLFYLWSYHRLVKKGYQVSPQKIQLYAVTSLISIYTWGTNPLGMALFVMNFFHAWQYFAIVWAMDKKNIAQRLRIPQKWAPIGVFLALLIVGFSYGTFMELDTGDFAFLAITVSIMHFWWDGFIWSVRKKQV